MNVRLNMLHSLYCRERAQTIEEKRWQNYASHLQKDNAIIDRRKQNYPPGRSGVAYDIISNSYLQNTDGVDLKHREEGVKVRFMYLMLKFHFNSACDELIEPF